MTAPTLTLADFLLARIAEDEAAARAATQGRWTWDEPQYQTRWVLWASDGESVLSASYDDSGVEGSDADKDHIARWDPARVLAECEARRRIVELHEIVTKDYAGKWWTDPKPPGAYVVTGCDHCRLAGSDGEEYVVDGPCPTLRLLALPYALQWRKEQQP